jgi:hypothetical protein
VRAGGDVARDGSGARLIGEEIMPYQHTARSQHEFAQWPRSETDARWGEERGRIRDGWACALLACLAIAVGWMAFSRITIENSTVSATSIQSR